METTTNLETVNKTIEHLCECIEQTRDVNEKARLVDALANLIMSRATAYKAFNEIY